MLGVGRRFCIWPAVFRRKEEEEEDFLEEVAMASPEDRATSMLSAMQAEEFFKEQAIASLIEQLDALSK